MDRQRSKERAKEERARHQARDRHHSGESRAARQKKIENSYEMVSLEHRITGAHHLTNTGGWNIGQHSGKSQLSAMLPDYARLGSCIN